MHSLLAKLTGGDRRSIGRANAVAAEVVENPSLFPILVEGMRDEDQLVRMRAADAAEKVSAHLPELLQPHKRTLLALAASTAQQEVRWHLALMLPRLRLGKADRAKAVAILRSYLSDKSRIVVVSAMEGLAAFAEQWPALRQDVIATVRRLMRNGGPAVRSRGKKLLRRLGAGPA